MNTTIPLQEYMKWQYVQRLAIEGIVINFCELIVNSKQRIKAAGMATSVCTFKCKLNSMMMKQI